MSLKGKLLISATLGILIGFIIPHLVFYTFFITNPLSIIPWGIAGVILCLCASSRKESILMAMVYMGFLLESFLFLGQLKFDTEFLKVIVFLGFILVIGLLAGLIMGLVVYYLKKLTLKLMKRNN